MRLFGRPSMRGTPLDFVTIPTVNASPGQLKSTLKRINHTMRVKNRLGASLRGSGHKFLTPAYMKFCQRFEARSQRSQEEGDNGWVHSYELDPFVEKFDGSRAVRDKRRRQEIVKRLCEAGLAEKERGWARWLGVNPPLRLATRPPGPSARAPRRANPEDSNRTQWLSPGDKAQMRAKRAIDSLRKAEARLGAAKPCLTSSKKIKPTQTCGPAGAALRHAARDGSGRYAAKAVSKGSPQPQALEATEPPSSAAVLNGGSCSTPLQTTRTTSGGAEIVAAQPDPQIPPRAQVCHAQGQDGSRLPPQAATFPPLEPNMPVLTEPTREEDPVDASLDAQNTAQAIKDPTIALLFANLMDKAKQRDEARAAEGLPPLEPYVPKAKPAPPKLNTLGQTEAPARRVKVADYRLKDDGAAADVTWLQMNLGGFTALKGLHMAWAARQGYSRGLWRQAVAVLVSTAPGRVGDPKAFIMGTLKRLMEENGPDPRGKAGYFPLATWGGVALKFASLTI